MSDSEDRGDQIRRQQCELIEANHRREAIEREEAELRRLKPLLAADIDAAWDAPRKTAS